MDPLNVFQKVMYNNRLCVVTDPAAERGKKITISPLGDGVAQYYTVFKNEVYIPLTVENATIATTVLNIAHPEWGVWKFNYKAQSLRYYRNRIQFKMPF